MITDKETDIIYLSELLKSDMRFMDTCNQIIRILDSCSVEHRFLPNTKDIWARDYMPIQISDSKFIEYRYDPDYLQSTRKGNRDLKTYPDMVCESIDLKTVKTDIVLDGGNVVKSKNCIIFTDKIVHENRLFYTKLELLKRLKEIFEVENVVLIPWDKKEIFGHSDGVVRFIDDQTVLINEIYQADRMLRGRLQKGNLKCEFFSFDVKKRDKNNWAYINFLQTKELILLPMLNVEEDEQAFRQINDFYTDYADQNRILQVDVNQIVQFGGALNCISWNIKSEKSS
jgi:agmatine/peptidylarginine deiminase